MILIVTNKQDYTTDYLVIELQKQGVDFVRLNTEDFPNKISLSLEIDKSDWLSSYFIIYGKEVILRDIASVWYRRPRRPIPSKNIDDPVSQDFVMVESEHTLSAVWRLLDCNWVSHPDYLRIAESKPYQLIIASRLGFKIPHTLITNEPHTAKNFIGSNAKSKIYKPVRLGYVSREDSVSLIYTNLLDDTHFSSLDMVKYAPSIFQDYIHKKSEIRATIVGDSVFAIELASQSTTKGKHDWRRADLGELRHTPFDLPDDIEQQCISIVKELNLQFGAIDLIRTPDDEFVFLEINPNGQWAWIEQMLPEVKIRQALINLLLGT